MRGGSVAAGDGREGCTRIVGFAGILSAPVVRREVGFVSVAAAAASAAMAASCTGRCTPTPRPEVMLLHVSVPSPPSPDDGDHRHLNPPHFSPRDLPPVTTARRPQATTPSRPFVIPPPRALSRSAVCVGGRGNEPRRPTGGYVFACPSLTHDHLRSAAPARCESG